MSKNLEKYIIFIREWLLQKEIFIYRWVCIYPAYINKKKTKAEGRILSRDKCVDNPTYQEMKDVLAASGLKFGVENKMYCRERSKELSARGRIRVQLKNDDGTPLNRHYPTRKFYKINKKVFSFQLPSVCNTCIHGENP